MSGHETTSAPEPRCDVAGSRDMLSDVEFRRESAFFYTELKYRPLHATCLKLTAFVE